MTALTFMGAFIEFLIVENGNGQRNRKILAIPKDFNIPSLKSQEVL